MDITGTGNTIKAIAGAVVADGIALGVAFGANVSTAQQAAILAFVGSVTTAGVAVVGWIETHHIRGQAAVAAVSLGVPAAKPAATK